MSNPLATKRASCERCRNLKLRCIPYRDTGRCERCHSTNAECVYGFSGKAGRPPSAKNQTPSATAPVRDHTVANTETTQELQSGQQQPPSDWRTSSSSSPSSSSRPQQQHQVQDQQHQRYTTSSLQDAATKTPAPTAEASHLINDLPDAGHVTSSHPFAACYIPTTASTASDANSNVFPFASWQNDLYPFTSDDQFPSYHEQAQVPSATPPSGSTDPVQCVWPLSPLSSDRLLQPSSKDGPESSRQATTDGASQLFGDSGTFPTLTTNFLATDISMSPNFASSPSTIFSFPSASSSHTTSSQQPVPQEARRKSPVAVKKSMQALSDISTRLFNFIVTYDPDHGEVIEGNGTASLSTRHLEQLIRDVLESSAAFQDILGRLKPGDEKQTSDYLALLASNSTHLGPQHRRLSSTPSSSHFPLQTPTLPLDTATILQILIPYLRLTQLYHILYINLLSISCSSHSIPSAIPSITILFSSSSLPLPPPRLRLSLILHLTVHYLSDIENRLGLPAALRATPRPKSKSSSSRGKGTADEWTVLGGFPTGEDGGSDIHVHRRDYSHTSATSGTANAGMGFVIRSVMIEGGSRAEKIGDILKRLREIVNEGHGESWDNQEENEKEAVGF